MLRRLYMGLRNVFKPKKIRVVVGSVELCLVGDGATRLDAISKKSGFDANEVVRQALQLYQAHMDEYYKGTLFFKKPPGGEMIEFQVFADEDD
ncbi:MAG: hypothetical protein QG589_406 [Patescibacteria group bacterium]|nr:hypothetical protein [Patescibacteria group bacterium]